MSSNVEQIGGGSRILRQPGERKGRNCILGEL